MGESDNYIDSLEAINEGQYFGMKIVGFYKTLISGGIAEQYALALTMEYLYNIMEFGGEGYG